MGNVRIRIPCYHFRITMKLEETQTIEERIEFTKLKLELVTTLCKLGAEDKVLEALKVQYESELKNLEAANSFCKKK